MTLTQWLILIIIALIAAVLGMTFIPRQKRAQPFEAVMWLAAWIVATLCAFLGVGASQNYASLQFLNAISILDISILPALIGAFGGVLILTIPLWFLGRETVSDDETELE